MKISIRWRPSQGRGEYEAVPAAPILGRELILDLRPLRSPLPCHIRVVQQGGKPRLRSTVQRGRQLVPQLMAALRLPEPRREDVVPTWPLEEKGFVLGELECEAELLGVSRAVLKPLIIHILHSDQTIDVQERIAMLAREPAALPIIERVDPKLAREIENFHKKVLPSFSYQSARNAAEEIINTQQKTFGGTNSTPVSIIANLPMNEEDVVGKEGAVLRAIHHVKERDRGLLKKARRYFIQKNGALYCEACDFKPERFYGPRAEGRIEIHHLLPVSEMMADAETRFSDLAFVCANCHGTIHAKRPWLEMPELKKLVQGSSYLYGR